MDEFWVCQHCKSLNKAGTGKCYSCREKYGTRPKEGASGNKAAAPSAPPPPSGSIPDFGPPGAPGPSFSRPVALAPVSRPPDRSAHQGVASRIPNPVAAVQRRIAQSLALRQSVSVEWLGYVTVALIGLVLVTGAITALTALPAATNLLQHADSTTAWAQLSAGQQGVVKSASIAFVVVGAAALLCFSVFVGLTTNNATGLGAEQPILTPYRAGTCWAGVLWTQARIAAGLIVPALLLWRGYEILGLIAALIAVELVHTRMDNASGWLSRPYRHLPDLYDKLGTEGSIASPIARIWSACFRVANAMAIAVFAVPIVGFGLFIVSALRGSGDVIGWSSTGLGIDQIVVALLVAGFVGWTAVSFALLIPMVLGLVRRQRTRKTLVRVGRARSWVARPGQGAYSASSMSAQSQPENLGPYDEDRIVERRPMPVDAEIGRSPGIGGSLFGGPRSTSADIDGPGLGGSIPRGPGFGDSRGPEDRD